MLSQNRMPGPFLSLDNQKVPASRRSNRACTRDIVNHSPDSPARARGRRLFVERQFIAYECAILCVVPANAGTHNHRSLVEQKPLAAVSQREAATYGSPRSRGRHWPVENRI